MTRNIRGPSPGEIPEGRARVHPIGHPTQPQKRIWSPCLNRALPGGPVHLDSIHPKARSSPLVLDCNNPEQVCFRPVHK